MSTVNPTASGFTVRRIAGDAAKEASAMTEFRIVEFHGQPLWAVRADEGQVFVAVKPICENIGISWPRQYRIILED